MKIFLSLILILLSSIPIQASLAETEKTVSSGVVLAPIYKENTAYQTLSRPKRLEHFFHLDLNPFGSFTKGLGYRLEYSFGMQNIDLGVTYLRSGFGNFSPNQDASDPNSFPFLYQAQSNADTWSLNVIEFGYFIRGRVFPLAEKKWTQYARISLGYAFLSDSNADLHEKGLLYGIEAGLENLISSNFSFAPFLNWRFGMLYPNNVPVSTLTLGLGFGFGR